MANIDDGFRVERLSLDDLALVVSHTDDPTVGVGYEAPTGSLLLRTNGVVYRKTGTADVDWTPIDNIMGLHRHNGAVTQTFSALTTLLFGTSVRTDANYSYVDGAITVTAAGWYDITFDVAYTGTTNNRTISETVTQVNGVAVPGSYAYGYHRTVVEGLQTTTSTVRIQLSANDVVTIAGRVFTGVANISSIASACRLNIKNA